MVRKTFLSSLVLLFGAATAATAAPESYVRFVQDEENSKNAALQTAVAHFTHPDKQVEIVLYGVVHIADKAYYEAVQRDLDSYDVVLYEGVAPGKTQPTEADKGLGEMQQAMGNMLGLTFQKDGINYKRKNLVHADMNMDQLKKAMGGETFNPLGQVMGKNQMKQMGPMLKMAGQFMKSPAMKPMRDNLKRMMAGQLANADMGKAMGEKTMHVILIERNKVVMKVLEKQLQKTTKGKIAIFYGAAHNPDFEERFAKLGWTKTSKRWMSAWKIGDGADEGEEDEDEDESDETPKTAPKAPETKKGPRWF